MGPKSGEQEVINQDPTTRYLLGILWPKLDPRAEDEEENFQDTGTHVQEDANEEIIDNPSSVFKRRKPSCAGLSFYVELNQTSEVKLVKFASSDVILPESLLLYKFKFCRLIKFPISDGISPMRPSLGKIISVV